MTVATALAVSWKPLINSKKQASSMLMTSSTLSVVSSPNMVSYAAHSARLKVRFFWNSAGNSARGAVVGPMSRHLRLYVKNDLVGDVLALIACAFEFADNGQHVKALLYFIHIFLDVVDDDRLCGLV